MSFTRTGGGVEILAKASAVLGLLEARGQASILDIAAALGEPASSMYRLVSSLTDYGWVEQGSRRGQYRIGSRIITISGLVESRLDLQQITRDVLTPIRTETPGRWSLFVRRALRAVCVEIVADQVAASFSPRIGDSLPLDEGAAALVLVAFLPPPEREAALDRLLAARSGGRSALDARYRFRIDADRARRAGLAIDIEETAPGVASIAAPVLNRRGEIEAALCLSGLDPELAGTAEAAHDTALVGRAARRISAGFGYREENSPDTDDVPVLGGEA